VFIKNCPESSNHILSTKSTERVHAKLVKTTGIPCTREIRGFSPQMSGDSDCDGGNCDGGLGACECNCDCPDN